MISNRSLSRWGCILASLFIISLILWNTYLFFNQLKENERVKMEIWAAAYQELLADRNTDDATVGHMVLTVIQSNTTTPMILNKIKEGTFAERIMNQINLKNLEKNKK